MSKAFKCNRCGKYYEKYDTTARIINEKLGRSGFDSIITCKRSNVSETNGFFNVSSLLDLCPKCKEEFINWFNSPNKERNE